MFVLLWTVRDFKANSVLLCPNCQSVLNETPEATALIQATYKQPSQDRCPICYGSYYVGPAGGVKAILIRPSIWQFGEEQLQYLPRGATNIQSGSVTTTGDFRMEPRDFIFRGDGRRFQVNQVQVTHLSSGFGTQASSNTAISATYGVAEENPTSPAYLIGPDAQGLMDMLDPAYTRNTPPDFTGIEFADGPVVF
jgi:hypothetical protein